MIWRNRVNFVSGWFVGFGLFLFVTYLDPLNVYTPTQPGNSAGLDAELLLMHFFFATLSVGGFAAWAVPLVRTSPGFVQVRNPATTWTFPDECLESLREGVMFPRLAYGERVVRLWGLERSVADTMRGHIVVPTAEPAAGVMPANGYGVKRSIHPALAVLAGLWTAVTLVGLLAPRV